MLLCFEDPGMTAIWEQALDEIAAGRLSLETFVAKQAHWVAQLVERCATLTLTLPVEAGPACPVCNAPMHKRRGKSGPFWSCSQYPACSDLQTIESPRRHQRPAKPR